MPSDPVQQALLGFLPGYLLRQAAAGVGRKRWESRFPAAGLMADISGFTALAEALAHSGRPGAEELALISR